MGKIKKTVRVYRLDKGVPLPEQKTPGSAGWDVYASETVLLEPGKVTLIPTGLIIEAPEGYHFRVYIRSGFSVKNNVSLVNSVGIIDGDYCGPEDFLKIAMVANFYPGAEPVVINRGDRIAQLIFEKNAVNEIEWREEQNPAFHGESRGGFGSTGK
jgi:dUTP pyrophosphatase